MIRFYCRCGTEIFFENSHCAVCGRLLGFDPETQSLLPLQAADETYAVAEAGEQRYKICALQRQIGCNWLVPAHDAHTQCISCRLTRTIPALSKARNLLRWQRLEQTKRRALYMVFRLRLPFGVSLADADAPAQNGAMAADLFSPSDAEEANTTGPTRIPQLIFDFIEDRRSNPDVAPEFVYSGHRDGVITLNAAEADDSYRAEAREQMNEAYRTLLGHLRHELGHYYWYLLANDAASLHAFRELFGDERNDYHAALDRYYLHGSSPSWRENHISAYASAHPLEDWAETWAHYLHIGDTLETASVYEVIDGDAGAAAFDDRLAEWMKLSVALNALNRSMGVEDAYPFVITATINRKLQFIDRLVQVWRMPGRIAARR